MTDEFHGSGETNPGEETSPPVPKAKPRKPLRAEETPREEEGAKAQVETAAAEEKVVAPAAPVQAAGGGEQKTRAKEPPASKVLSPAERMRFRRRR